MLILIGNTSCGKTTLAKLLKKEERYEHILELTTRNMREGEQNGKDYWFTTEANYREQDEAGELIGSMQFTRYQNDEYQHVYYGTRKAHVEAAGDKAVLVTNAGAAKKIKEYNDMHGNPYKIFIVHVKIDTEEQRRRLTLRGDNPLEIEKRIKSDAEALADVDTYATYTVDNSFSSPGCVCEEIKWAYEKYLHTLFKAECMQPKDIIVRS